MRRPNLVLDTNAASHSFGRYTVWIDGCIEEQDPESSPQIGYNSEMGCRIANSAS